MTHGLEQWTLDAERDFRAFQTAYMSMLRRSIRPIMHCSSACLRDDQVCALLGVLTARETHAVALTRSLAQVVHADMSYLHGLLFAQGSWLRHSIQAARTVTSTVDTAVVPLLPDSAAQFSDWHAGAKGCLGDVAKLLRRFCRKVIGGRGPLADQALTHARARDRLEAQGVLLQHVPDELEDRPRSIVCPVCHKHFATVAAEAAHARRVHGRVALHTQSLRGTACQVCQREYWTSARLREHLRFSTACCHTYIGADLGEVLPQEKGCAGPAGATCKPITPLIGPQPWWASLHPGMVPDEDFVYATQDSYWHAVLLALSRTLSAEHRGSEQPCPAGIAQQVGRWLMLRPAGLPVDTSCLLDSV